MSNDLKEYIVTLKSYDDLDSFYDDMETPGGNLHIPNRAVPVANRRPNSRSTHYCLTDEEVQQLQKDDRVLSVDLCLHHREVVIRPVYTQSSELWDKSSNMNIDPTYGVRNNWGLLRCYLGQQVTNWGSPGTDTIQGTIQVNQSGYNVDIVVVDGHFNPALSELQHNSSGTGGTRVVQYNWFQHNVTPGTYVYTPYSDPANAALTENNNHGAHVAGIAAGNSQGWARNANIYNISPYNPSITALVFDYIRAWHASKPINPAIGRKNPTIINNSWGIYEEIDYTSITSIVYRGITYNGPFTTSDLQNYGLYTSGTKVQILVRDASLDAAIEDCIADGIIVVGAAGNEYTKVSVPGDTDYFNTVFSSQLFSGQSYYSRGSSPGSSIVGTLGSITVGAIDVTTTEKKTNFSNCGPRVNVYAPGKHITSCLNSDLFVAQTTVQDQRGVGYFAKKDGTSMASPQVAGVLACLLQVYPDMNQEQAVEYITEISKNNQISNPIPSSPVNLESLQGSPNKYLYYKNERNVTGDIYPNNNYWIRPTSGLVWPRTNYRVA